MKTHSIPDGYACCGGTTSQGWFAGILLLTDRDREFTKDIPGTDRKVQLLAGKELDEWEATMVAQPRRVVVVDNFGGGLNQETVTEADRIFGPVTVGERITETLLVWTERKGGGWRLVLRRRNDVSLVYESSTMLRAPAVALWGESYVLACEIELAGQTGVRVMTADGTVLLEIPGGAPSLACVGDTVCLLCETRSSARGIEQRLVEIGNQGSPRHTVLASDDLNMFGNLASDPDTGTIYACWESTPAWGYDPYTGRHRDINLWTYRPGGELSPADGTSQGKLPVPLEAYVDNHDSNMPPIRPQVFVVRGEPSVVFRRFRYRGKRCFGWDVYCMSRAGGHWSAPRRISGDFGPPDAGYSVRAIEDRLVSFLPCCDNDEGSRRTYNHRVQILQMPIDLSLRRVEVPVSDRGFYVFPFGIDSPAPDPPHDPSGRRLIWGDIHSHSFNSKCICSINGSPEDVLRYQRDILGCSVLTLTDHTHHMGAQEFAWQLDRLEAFAGENRIVLYSCEPGTKPGHHTNFYALDRQIFERLRPIVLAYWDRSETYAAIKERLPAGSVLALRHFHGFRQGPFGIAGEETVRTWDPELEVAMEAMQVRGNIMLGGLPRFPGNFLNAGARIGLVGGSDHSTGKSPNHFCLTGFWVEEATAQGVWDAIVNRRTVACSNGKVSLWTELNGTPMGSEASVEGRVSIAVRVAAPRKIHRACLIRDGEPLDWVGIGANTAEFVLADDTAAPGPHWYAVTVEGESAFQGSLGDDDFTPGAAGAVIAHASPYFVDVT
jgi:hypothetical protein